MSEQTWLISEYLGDGVYMHFDGYNIWLYANNHIYPTDKICLEPKIVSCFIKQIERIKKLKICDNCNGTGLVIGYNTRNKTICHICNGQKAVLKCGG